MRTSLLAGITLIGTALVLFAPEDAAGQQKFGGKQGRFGGPGGFTFNPLERLSRNPERSFEFLSRGRGYVLVTDGISQEVKDAMADYAKRKGINNGQLNREQFIAFGEEVRVRLDNGTLKSTPITIPPKGEGNPSAASPKDGANADSADALKKAAEEEFKRRDTNGDGFLNKDEMPEALKAELSKWDKNGDKLISLDEFRDYFVARAHGTTGAAHSSTDATVVVIDQEELERRPVVFRAGKLPKELPPWFGQLDTDGDGQIALWEWRKSGKSIDEFAEWDRDQDGFITAEEVLHKMGLGAGSIASAAKKEEKGAEGQANRGSFPVNAVIVPGFRNGEGNAVMIPFNGNFDGKRGFGDRKGGKNGGYKMKQRPE